MLRPSWTERLLAWVATLIVAAVGVRVAWDLVRPALPMVAVLTGGVVAVRWWWLRRWYG